MKNCGFRLKNNKYSFNSAKETFLNALRSLKATTPDLYVQLGKQFNTKSRGHFVQKIEDVYIKSPELASKEGNIAIIEPGWFVATNISNKEKEDRLKSACKFAHIRYQEEFEIWFHGGGNKYSPKSKEETKPDLAEIDRLLGF
jgi:hypothetical protein